MTVMYLEKKPHKLVFMRVLYPGRIDLFTDTAAILKFIVSNSSGGKLVCVCPLSIP